MRFIRRLVTDDSGQDLVEYALLVGVFATGLIVLFDTMGSKVTAAFGAWVDNANNQWVPSDP